MTGKIEFNPVVMQKLATWDIYIKDLIKKVWLEIAFNTTVMSWKLSDSSYKDMYVKYYEEMWFNDDLVYKNGKYINNDGWYSDWSPKEWKFSYCAMMKIDKNSKFIYIPVTKDLKFWKLKISSLRTLIKRLSEFYWFWIDKNLDVLFSAFNWRTYNNTKNLFLNLNNTIENAIKNKGKKVWEIPKGYF